MKTDTQKGHAPGVGGAQIDPAGELASTGKKIVDCGEQNITAVCQELILNGVGLRCTSGYSQLETLVRALKYRGERGLNTYEGTAAGYLRFATRIFNLKEEAWDIYTLKEDVIGPDGLLHKGVARYVLLGRRKDIPLVPPQSRLPTMGARS